MKNKIIKNGTAVKINQGFNEYTYGEVISFDKKRKNICGFKSNYQIKITGCSQNLSPVLKSCLKIGAIKIILRSHVSYLY